MILPRTALHRHEWSHLHSLFPRHTSKRTFTRSLTSLHDILFHLAGMLDWTINSNFDHHRHQTYLVNRLLCCLLFVCTAQVSVRRCACARAVCSISKPLQRHNSVLRLLVARGCQVNSRLSRIIKFFENISNLNNFTSCGTALTVFIINRWNPEETREERSEYSWRIFARLA